MTPCLRSGIRSSRYSECGYSEYEINQSKESLSKPASVCPILFVKIVSEYDQEIPQLQTADKPMTPQGRATQQSRDTWKTNQARLSSSLFPIKMIAKPEGT